MRLHVHGNCQSFVLAKMLQETFPEWKVTHFEVHANPIILQNDEYRSAISAADIILSQPIHKGYRGREDLSLEWVKEAAKASCEVVVIPSMHFEGHHPDAFAFPLLGDLCSSALAAHLMMVGVAPSQVVRILLSPDLLHPEDVRAEIDRTILEMRRREIADEIEVPLSAITADFAGPVQMFHKVNHPFRKLHAYVANGALERLSLSQAVSVAGKDYQAMPHYPMLRTIAAYYGCGDAARDAQVLLPYCTPMTQEIYFTAMVEQLARHPAESIRSAIEKVWQAAALMRRLAAAGRSNIPGLESWR